MLALLFASLFGTLFVYQGQEIGMVNISADWPIEEYNNVNSINYYAEVADLTSQSPQELAKGRASLQHLA